MSDPRPPESESPPQIRDTEPSLVLDDLDETTDPRATGLVDNKQLQEFLSHYEQGLDARFTAMEFAVIGHLRELLDARLVPIEAAVRQTCALAERAANAGIVTVTICDRIETIERRCARINGPFAGSMPPNGGSDA